MVVLLVLARVHPRSSCNEAVVGVEGWERAGPSQETECPSLQIFHVELFPCNGAGDERPSAPFRLS